VLSRTASLRYARGMSIRAASLVLFLFVSACGGSEETPGSAGTGDVAAKAVADVDAAMADAQRTRTAPPGASAPVQQ
jgi:hypothetical protein